jgi:hypothetical protein
MTRWGAASWKAAGLAVAFGLVLAGVGSASAGPSLRSYSDGALAKGFMATVFGLEHGSSGAGIVKKWHRPVRFRIENESATDRSRVVAKFIGQLSSRLPGIDARLARPGEEANFVVHVVDRSGYAERVRTVAYGGTHGRVPGRCMVKVDFGRRGIDRSDAFIVADEGDGLFQRCMIEEILQGLGPMNDSAALEDSVFNDTSRHTRLMAFDRAVVAMLYDSRVRHGMSRSEVEAIMPDLVARVRRTVR